MARGRCKDVLADAFARFGRVPIHAKGTETVPAGTLRPEWPVPLWAAGGLVFDPRGRVALVRAANRARYREAWLAPGGILEEGEPADAGFAREVLEETGLRVEDVHLTRIHNVTLREETKDHPLLFAQFVGRAVGATLAPRAADVVEARWFDRLPEAMAYRSDYVEDYVRWRPRLAPPPSEEGQRL